MKTFRTIWSGVRSLAQPRAVKREIDEELQFHLRSATKTNMDSGMSPDHAALTAAEVAFSLVLLTSAGLMIQSFARMWRVERGFQPEHLLSAELDFPVSGFTTWVQETATRPQVPLTELIEHLRSFPGVQAVGARSKLLRRENLPPNESISIPGPPAVKPQIRVNTLSCVLKMKRPGCITLAVLLLGLGGPDVSSGASSSSSAKSFVGEKAGDEIIVGGIKLCWCPAGKFLMGSPRNEPERRPGEDQVQVTLTKGFWMGKFEATQGQWKRVMGKLPGELTAELPEGDDYPVGNVNFAETEAFCRKLIQLAHQSGELANDWEFRLPTEAQWEYACRAGTTTATSFGGQLSSKQANFKGKPYNGAEPGPSLGHAAKVGSYPGNAWGLHDMHGNIFEWCRDWYQRKLPGGVDPDLYSAKDAATKSGNGSLSRVRRGGCWADEGWPCRSAFRLPFEPERRYDHIGFRVAVVQP